MEFKNYFRSFLLIKKNFSNHLKKFNREKIHQLEIGFKMHLKKKNVFC
jgi:hypothetical protein